MMILLSVKKKNQRPRLPINSNFPQDFLHDFELGPLTNDNWYHWEFSNKALQRFHLPITYMDLDGEEGPEHYSKKQQVHDYIYENYYLGGGAENSCKFYVTTELKQLHGPFKALMAENPNEDRVLYKLDVCAIRIKDNQVFDLEIDGSEHTSHHRMMTDTMRDRLLNYRYGIYTLRFDRDDSINFKKLDDFLNQKAMPYTRNRVLEGKKIIANNKM